MAAKKKKTIAKTKKTIAKTIAAVEHGQHAPVETDISDNPLGLSFSEETNTLTLYGVIPHIPHIPHGSKVCSGGGSGTGSPPRAPSRHYAVVGHVWYGEDGRTVQGAVTVASDESS